MSAMKTIDFTRPTKFTPDHERRLGRALAAAEKIARLFGVAEHKVIAIDLRQFGKSSLTAMGR